MFVALLRHHVYIKTDNCIKDQGCICYGTGYLDRGLTVDLMHSRTPA